MFFQGAQGFGYFSTGGVVEVSKPLNDLRVPWATYYLPV